MASKEIRENALLWFANYIHYDYLYLTTKYGVVHYDLLTVGTIVKMYLECGKVLEDIAEREIVLGLIKVQCKDQNVEGNGLTRGRQYECVQGSISGNDYTIIDDNGKMETYHSSFFDVIKK